MIHGSLFSGIGGFDLAAQWAGWQNAFHCELNPFGRKVLHHYWPNSVSYENIKTTDFSMWRGRIDVLSGGFPCQPYSVAGKRLGTADERHLWPEMLRAIREIAPRWVVGENVHGLVSWSGGLVFEEVQTDLEGLGYEVQPYVFPAAGVGAPHKRDRVWFVAYAKSNGNRGGLSGMESPTSSFRESEKYGQNHNEHWHDGKEWTAPYAPSQQSERARPEQRKLSEPQSLEFGGSCSRVGSFGNATNFHLQRRQQHNNTTKPSDQGYPNDGIPPRLAGITVSKHRNESIKAYGNAIVPQVAFQIFTAINAYTTHPTCESNK